MTIPGMVASNILCLAKKMSVFFGKQCFCCEENAGIERVHPFLVIDVKSANMEVCVAKPQICAKSGSGVGRCNCSMGANVILRSHRVRSNVSFFLSLTLRGACLEDVFLSLLQRQYDCWFEAFLNKLVVFSLVCVYFLAVALLLQLLCNCSGGGRRRQKS